MTKNLRLKSGHDRKGPPTGAQDAWGRNEPALAVDLPAHFESVLGGGSDETGDRRSPCADLSRPAKAQDDGAGPDRPPALRALQESVLRSRIAALERMVAVQSVELRRVAGQERFLKSLLDAGPDAMLVADAAGTITSFSPAAERLFGWSSAEVVGSHVSRLMPEAYAQQTPSGKTAPARSLGVVGVNREVVGRRREGERFPMMVYVCAAPLDEGPCYIKILRDLTPARRAQAREGELQAQLTRASGLHALGEIGAVLAHELNQPLAAIANYVQGARALAMGRQEVDERSQEAIWALDGARDQAIRAGDIIKRIRSLVAGGAVARGEESLRSVVLDVDFMIGLLTREAGVNVLYDLCAEDDAVVVDRVQIQQVVLNLVRNAVEAMRGSSARTLEIRTRAIGDEWVLCVDDSGPGVSGNLRKSLSGAPAIGDARGLGLGLSICKTIVEHHGGRIWAETGRTGGASVRVSLPKAARRATPPVGGPSPA